MSVFSSLNRHQKEAVGLLQTGTFLEYFDLMLYVHMAVLLNELFFPKTDPHTAALLTALAFCSTYVLRPFGALIFGWIGDNIGRKTTVVITTLMMSVSCMIMANLPTYAEIGISAAWVITACRIIQGLSSMGEIMGAQVYLTETIKPPMQYVIVSFISVASAVGSSAALGVAFLVTSIEFNWRIAFWIGAGVAMIGSIARVRLRETPEFIKERSLKQHERKTEPATESSLSLDATTATKTINKADFIAYFLSYCGWPVSFYLAYIYFNPLLKNYGYSSEDIILHNFLLSIVLLLMGIFYAIKSYTIHPLKILKTRVLLFMVFMILMPVFVSYATTPTHLFLIQATILALNMGEIPAASIFIVHFPVLKRFTTTSFIYASTRALMYIFTSFGLVYLTEHLGYYGLYIIVLPVAIGVLYGINHFAKRENNKSYQAQPLSVSSSL